MNDAVVYVLKYERDGHTRPCYKIGITKRDPAVRRRENENRLDGWRRTLSFECHPVTAARAGELELTQTMSHIAAYGFRYVRGSEFDHASQAQFPTWIRNAYKLTAAILQRCYHCHGEHLAFRCPNRACCDGFERFLEHGVTGFELPVKPLSRHDGPSERRDDTERRLERLARRLSWRLTTGAKSRSKRTRYNLRTL